MSEQQAGRKITILGMGPTAHERRIDILKYCEGTEIWGLNNGYQVYPHLQGRWSRFFELHAWRYLESGDWKNQPPSYFLDLDNLGCPVYVGQPLPLIQNQVRYDFLAVCSHFHSNYFLGSPSLMLMLALYEHDQGQTVEEIRSWGIDTSDPQHAQQRASWAWWLAHAHQRGIALQGSSTAFQVEREMDDGLRGLRERIGNEMTRQQQREQEPERERED